MEACNDPRHDFCANRQWTNWSPNREKSRSAIPGPCWATFGPKTSQSRSSWRLFGSGVGMTNPVAPHEHDRRRHRCRLPLSSGTIR
jgi:hypothetical protein